MQKYYGKKMIINGPVVCIEEDEDLKLYDKCCEHVCKIYNEITNEKEASYKEKETTNTTK
jgi:hypothetical protein